MPGLVSALAGPSQISKRGSWKPCVVLGAKPQTAQGPLPQAQPVQVGVLGRAWGFPELTMEDLTFLYWPNAVRTHTGWAAQGGLQAQLKPGICLSHFISAFLPSLWFLSRLAFPSRWQK